MFIISSTRESMAVFFTILTFFSTLGGGFVGLKYKDKLHLILGFTAGVLLAVVAFDIFPEIIELTNKLHVNPSLPMVALVTGFLIFHVFEKLLLPIPIAISEEVNSS